MPNKSRKSTGPRTPSAKRRAAAARHRNALIEELITLPPHRLAQAHLRAEEAAQFYAADPALAAEARQFLLLRAHYTWLVLRIGAFTDAFLHSPDPCQFLHANLRHLELLLCARRRLDRPINDFLRLSLPAFLLFQPQAQAPPPAAALLPPVPERKRRAAAA